MASESQPRVRRSEPLRPFILILAATALVWALYWLAIVLYIPDGDKPFEAQAYRSQFGDMFGAINALFSAMAFAVLIYTMSLQRTELRLQREELEDTRFELARSASAQEKSEQSFQKQVEAFQRFADAAAEQVRAMRALADATAKQEYHDRHLADAARKQAEATKDLASAIRDIKNKLR